MLEANSGADKPVSEDKQDQRQVARNNYDRYKRAADAGHREYKDLAQKCDDFYLGKQWGDDDLDSLKETRRPALTINMVLPIVNAVLGEFTSKRSEVNFRPSRNGDSKVAAALAKVYKHIQHANDMKRVEREVFEDGVIMERGYFDIRVDFTDNLMGDIRIGALDPLDVIPDPDAKSYDPKEWKEVFITRWMSVDDIEELYGEEKAEEVQSLSYSASSTFGEDSVEWGKESTFGGTSRGTGTQYAEGTATERKNLRRVRVIERQYRKVRHITYFVDNQTGDMREVPANWDEMRVETFALEHGLDTLPRNETRIRWTISADNVVLHDDWSPYKQFTVVPFFPYFRRGRPFGLVRNLIDPQEQFNKISSQALHIVNSTANSGWIVEEGALVNMTADELAAGGAKTGLVLEVNPGRTAPQKIQPNQIPTGIRDLSNMTMQSLRQISGVSEYMLGEASPEISGVALDGQISRGMSQLQVVFDHFDYTRTILARIVLELIQQYYTEPRVFRILNDGRFGIQQEQEVSVNEPDPVTGELLNDLTMGEYDVILDTRPARETEMDNQFSQVVQLRQAGVVIPDDAVIEYSTLEDKMELAERIRQMMGMGTPSEEEQQMAQIQQQLAMEQMTLQLEKLEAEIEKLRSEAMRNEAKAQADMVRPAVDYKAQVNKNRTALTNKSNELAAKLRVAQMQAEAGRLRESQAQTGRYNQNQSVKAGERGL
jgi:hypothetical protein